MESKEKTFKEKVAEVNKLLETYGTDAVQQYKTASGFDAVGYKPQAILDAVNDVFGPTGWKYVLRNLDIHTYTSGNGKDGSIASAEVVVQFLNSDGTVVYETGPQFGGSRVVMNNIPDAKKGAVTDAVGKALSLLSVGSAAYRGTLSKQYKDKAEIEKISDGEVAVSTTVSKSRFAFKGRPTTETKTANVATGEDNTTKKDVEENTTEELNTRPEPETVQVAKNTLTKPMFKSKIFNKSATNGTGA